MIRYGKKFCFGKFGNNFIWVSACKCVSCTCETCEPCGPFFFEITTGKKFYHFSVNTWMFPEKYFNNISFQYCDDSALMNPYPKETNSHFP